MWGRKRVVSSYTLTLGFYATTEWHQRATLSNPASSVKVVKLEVNFLYLHVWYEGPGCTELGGAF